MRLRDGWSQAQLAWCLGVGQNTVARWEEVKTMAQRALALTPQERTTSSYTLRAVLKLAEAEVHGGNRLTPERGFQRLNTWLYRSSEANYTGWMLSDMGKYLAMAGQPEEAMKLGEKAIARSGGERLMRLLDHGRLLLIAGYPGKALEQLPTLSEQDQGAFAYEALVRCEASLNLGKREEASGWLEQAYAVIEAEGLKHDRSQADALARRF